MDIRNFFGDKNAPKKTENITKGGEDKKTRKGDKLKDTSRSKRQTSTRAAAAKPKTESKSSSSRATKSKVASGTRKRSRKQEPSDDDFDDLDEDADESDDDDFAMSNAEKEEVIELDDDDEADVVDLDEEDVPVRKRLRHSEPAPAKAGKRQTKKRETEQEEASGPHKVKAMPVPDYKKAEPSAESLWVDKYRPRKLADLCANPKHASDLVKWLKSWYAIHASGHTKKKLASGEEKAVLLAGPPGVGKTSLAHVVCQELGMEAHEFNASDTRNKGAISNIVGSLALNEAIGKYCRVSEPSKAKRSKGQVLIMDEVDGMSAGDRGGMQELISVIKKSRVPIICIANDDSNPKVRSLANYCLKLKFRRPMVSQTRKRLQDICQKEGYSHVPIDAIEAVAEACNGDIRQMINMLQNWKVRGEKLTEERVKSNLMSEGKTFQTQSIFDLFRAFFETSHTVAERLDKYFMDPDLVPLMVQENYVQFKGSDDVDKLAEAATSISEADLGNKLLREESRWDLMPAIALLSSVLPGACVASQLFGRPQFPSWLGKMSSEKKNIRLAQEVDMRMKTRMNADWKRILLDYAPCLRGLLSQPLLREGQNGIDEVISILDAYYLSREDWETILDMTSVQMKSNPKDNIPTAVKSAFTRAYESRDHHTSTVSAIKVKKSASGNDSATAVDEEIIVEKDEKESEEADEDDNEDDQPEKDKFIKSSSGAGKKAAGKKSAAAGRGGRRGGKKGKR